MRTDNRIFFSYGHDANAPVVEILKKALELHGYVVWVDTSAIRAGDVWRRSITDGIVDSQGVVAFLSTHSVRDPGVCRDELTIALCTRDTPIYTVLLEAESQVKPPALLSTNQWLDMSAWRSMKDQGERQWKHWLNDKIDGLLSALNSSMHSTFQGEIQALRELLSPTEVASKQAYLLNKPIIPRPGVDAAIERWRNGDDHIPLIISGGPGMGKSVISALQLKNNPWAVCGIFCEWNKRAWSDASSLTRSLAFNLATQISDYRRLLLETLRKEPNLPSLNAHELFEEAILNPLNGCIDGSRGRYMIIIDGIDEAKQSQIAFVEILGERLPDWPRWLGLMVTTRPEAHVLNALAKGRWLSLSDKVCCQAQDVRRYIQATTSRTGEPPTVTSRLAADAADNFAYATFVCDALSQGGNTGDLAPSGLSGSYRQMMHRVSSSPGAADARQLLALFLVDGALDEADLLAVSGLTRGRLHAALRALGSLVLTVQEGKHVTRTVFHKSFADWLMDPHRSLDYAIDHREAAAILARHARDCVDTEANRTTHLAQMLAHYFAEGEMWNEYCEFLMRSAIPLAPYWARYSSIPGEHLPSGIHDYLVRAMQDVWSSLVDSIMSQRTPVRVNELDTFFEQPPTQSMLDAFMESSGRLRLDVFFRSEASDARSEMPVNPGKISMARLLYRITQRCLKFGLNVSDEFRCYMDRVQLSALFFNGRPPLSPDTEFIRRHFPGYLDDNGVFTPHNELAEHDPGLPRLAQIFNTECLIATILKKATPLAGHVRQLLTFGANWDRARIMVEHELALYTRESPSKATAREQDRRHYLCHISALMSSTPRWHPLPPDSPTPCGAMSDYMKQYRLPCCNSFYAADEADALWLRVSVSGCEPATPEILKREFGLDLREWATLRTAGHYSSKPKRCFSSAE